MRDFELDRPVDAVAMKANNPPKPVPVEPEGFLVSPLALYTVVGVAAHLVAAVAAAVYLGYVIKDEIYVY